VVSPVLANIYLHYVFDLWAHQRRRCHARGEVILVRGACLRAGRRPDPRADDIGAGFEHPAEAEQFVAEMRERMAGLVWPCIRRRRD
jgi:hypothetical protein